MRTIRSSHSIFVRSLLVVISLLYVISPLHSEFNILLHKISHNVIAALQVPDDHHAIKHTEKHHHQNVVHDHEFLVSNHNELKIDKHSKVKIETHKHELISFFNSLFITDHSQNNNEKDFIENKIDKHILSFNMELAYSIKEYKKKCLWFYYNLFKGLNLEIVIPPPQSSLS